MRRVKKQKLTVHNFSNDSYKVIEKVKKGGREVRSCDNVSLHLASNHIIPFEDIVREVLQNYGSVHTLDLCGLTLDGSHCVDIIRLLRQTRCKQVRLRRNNFNQVDLDSLFTSLISNTHLVYIDISSFCSSVIPLTVTPRLEEPPNVSNSESLIQKIINRNHEIEHTREAMYSFRLGQTFGNNIWLPKEINAMIFNFIISDLSKSYLGDVVDVL
jgi:hypothetical protein